MLTVTYKNEAGEKVVHPLEAGQAYIVGRGAEAPIRIRHASVSRAHAEFYEAEDGNWCVRDVGSSNHTFLNNEQIEVTYIQEGDAIRFGDFNVKIESAPDPVKRRAAAPEPAPVAEDRAGRRQRPSEVVEPAPTPPAPPAQETPAERRARQMAEMQGAAKTKAPEPPRRAEPEPAPAEGRRARPSAEPEPAPVESRRARPSAEPEPAPVESRRARPSAEPEPVESRRARPSAEPEPAPLEGRRARPSSQSVEPVPEPVAEGRRARPSVEPEPEPRRSRAPEPEPPKRVEIDDIRRAAPEAKKAVGGVDPAELRAAQDKASKLEDQLKEQKSKYDEALRRIEDLEARDARHDEELRDWQERYDKARGQTDHVQQLLERARDDIKEHEESIEKFEKEVAELESQLKQFEATREETADTLTELKSKAVQKDRRIDELQRELDMMEFDLRNAREELESVQNSMNFENTETRKLERELALLREVIHEKENHIKSLQLEIEDREKEIYDLKLGTGVKDLQQAKTEMMEKYFAKDKESNELREKLAKLEQQLKGVQGELNDAKNAAAEAKDLGNHPDMKRKDREIARLQADADAARDELERMGEKLQQFSPESKAKLESEVASLKRKAQQLEDKLEEAETAASTRGQSDAELAGAKRKIQTLEERIEDLEHDLEEAKKATKAAASAGEGDAALRRQVASLEDKVDELSLELRKAKTEVERWKGEADKASKAAAPAPAAKAVSFDKDGALDSIDAIMDLYRSWTSNLDVLKTYGEDIENGKDNPKVIQDAIDGIGQTLSSIEKDADDMRKELKGLRTAVEKG